MSPEQQDEALRILRQIAPVDRMAGWHTEDCCLEAEDWAANEARTRAYSEWDEAHPDERLPATLNHEQRGARLDWIEQRAAELVATLGTPTDRDLCEPDCAYPAVRELLDAIAASPSQETDQ